MPDGHTIPQNFKEFNKDPYPNNYKPENDIHLNSDSKKKKPPSLLGGQNSSGSSLNADNPQPKNLNDYKPLANKIPENSQDFENLRSKIRSLGFTDDPKITSAILESNLDYNKSVAKLLED
jgi:hypothetical protein